MVRQICVTVAEQAPDFGIGMLVMDLLQAETATNWDAAMIGLRALLSILLSAPDRVSPAGDAAVMVPGTPLYLTQE